MTLTSPSSPPTTNLACLECKSLHRGCSKTPPICDRCASNGNICIWQDGTSSPAPSSPKDRKPKRARTVGSGEEVSEALPPLRTLRQATKPLPRPPPPTTTLLPAQQQPQKGWFDGWDMQGDTQRFDTINVAPESALGYCKKLVSQWDMKPFQGLGGIEAPFLKATAPLDVSSAMKDGSVDLPSDLAELSEIYLEHVNLLYPLFSAPALRELVADARKDSSLAPELKALLLLVCANATRYLEHDDRGASLYSTATRMLSLAPPSVVKIRADVLRCIYLQDSNELHEAWTALSSAITSVLLLGAPVAAGPLVHHLTRLELLHAFLAGRQTSMPPPSPLIPAYPILAPTTSIQVASYAFTSLLISTNPEDLRQWAPFPSAAPNAEQITAAASTTQRKGNSIGSYTQMYYIVLIRMILLVRVAPFVVVRSEREMEASLRDAEELLEAAGRMQLGLGEGVKLEGLVLLGTFVATLACVVSSLRRGEIEAPLSAIECARSIFNSSSLQSDPLARKGLEVHELLRAKMVSNGSKQVGLKVTLRAPPPRSLPSPPSDPTIALS